MVLQLQNKRVLDGSLCFSEVRLPVLASHVDQIQSDLKGSLYAASVGTSDAEAELCIHKKHYRRIILLHVLRELHITIQATAEPAPTAGAAGAAEAAAGGDLSAAAATITAATTASAAGAEADWAHEFEEEDYGEDGFGEEVIEPVPEGGGPPLPVNNGDALKTGTTTDAPQLLYAPVLYCAKVE
jgi:hypothetical protein